MVIIPTYNEKENISAIIDAVMNLPHAFDVLVIDDGSPDGTADIVREKRRNVPAAYIWWSAPENRDSALPT